MTDYIGICSSTATIALQGEKSKVAGLMASFTPAWLERLVWADISQNISPKLKDPTLLPLSATEGTTRFLMRSDQMSPSSWKNLSKTEKVLWHATQGSQNTALPFHGTPCNNSTKSMDKECFHQIADMLEWPVHFSKEERRKAVRKLRSLAER